MLVFFKKLNQSYFSKVIFGNEKSFDVKGKWVVIIETPLGTKYILDVFIWASTKLKFFECGTIAWRNYALQIKNMRCIIFDPIFVG